MIYGETGKDFTIMAVCDSIYLQRYSLGLVVSGAIHSNNIHLHVTNPSEIDNQYLLYLKKVFESLNTKNLFTTSFDTLDISNLNSDEKKCFYTYCRLLVAKSISRCDILILDIDSLIMKPIIKPNSDIGIFLRKDGKEKVSQKPWGTLGRKVLAGIIYCSQNNLDFFDYMQNTIEAGPKIWGLDQVALYHAYKQFADMNKAITYFDSNMLDWHFTNQSSIWTGKNRLKDQNTTYLKAYNNYVNQSPFTFDEFQQ